MLPASDSAAGGGLLVHPATPGGDHAAAAAALAAHKDAGGRSLVLLVGRRGERVVMERGFLADEGLELGDLAHVPTLDAEAGAREARAAIVDALAEHAIAAARISPPLREAVADEIVQAAAKQAGTIGAMVFLGAADMPVISLLQIRMVVELAAVYDRPLGTDRALEVAAVFGAGFGWRALARTALVLVPGPGWVLKAGLAYGATKAVGEAAKAWYSEGGDLAERPVDGLRKRIEGLVKRAKAAKAGEAVA